MSAPRITRDPDNRSLTIEKEFTSPLARVWKAWSDPVDLARWWGPRDWPATSHRFDFREGGQWHFSMRGPEGQTVWGLLEYRKIVAQKEILADDYFSNEEGRAVVDQRLSRWEVTFEALSARSTRVTTKLVCPSDERLQFLIDQGFEAGYSSALTNLSEHLEGRGDLVFCVSADGTKIAYERLGAGPAIVLVGGALMGRDNPAATDLAAALSGQFTVYNYDRRGRGDSGNHPTYQLTKELDDLRAVIEAAGGRALVFGFSSGAQLALRAASAGVPVDGVVAWEPPYTVEPGDRRAPADAAQVVAALVARGQNARAFGYFLTKVFGAPFFVPWLMRLSPYWKPSVKLAPTLPYDLALSGDGQLPSELSSLKVPVLALHGSHTQPLLQHGTEALARTVPGAKLQVVPGQNHQAAGVDLARAVLAFVDSLKRTANEINEGLREST